MRPKIESLYLHERCKATMAIADLKRSIRILEGISPRTPKIEAALKESKEIERQLCEAVKNPAFIENLVVSSLNEIRIKADSFSKTQSKKGKKERTRNGLTPSERKRRDSRIRADFAKSTLNPHAFAIHHEKKGSYEKGNGEKLSASGIRKVVRKKDPSTN